LKSPITLTRCAFGAQTAKCTPGESFDGVAAAPEFLPRAVVSALGEQMQIEIGQDRPEAVRIDGLADLVPLVDAQPVEQIAG
jgi:hypothetical protein